MPIESETFRGRNVQEALAAVRASLGPGALIESTRNVSNGAQGWLGRSFVEVVAAPGDEKKGGASTPAPKWRASAMAHASTPPALMAGAAADPMLGPAIERELKTIRALLETLSSTRKPRDRALAALQAAGIEGTLAAALAAGAQRLAHDPGSLWALLRARLSERLHVLESPIEKPGPRIVACVGPTGVGKTTTLAKLAARAQLDHGRKASVVTLDTFRVGAIEQMRRFVELLGIPLDIARDRASFVQVVAARKADIVFVDTAGISSLESASMQRIGECLKPVEGRELDVLLVVPAAVRARDAQRIRSMYRTPKPTGLVITKLDETEQVGGAIHAAADDPVSIAYLCDGPRVPEDIRDATIDALIDFTLPESR
jgi:flagellar biosynthesis protein FlhF